MNNQTGAGLPEVLISLFLACLIMTALMNHYLCTKSHYDHLQTALDEAMELQLAVDIMRDSIRQAGFTPCMSVDQLTTLDHRDGNQHLMAINRVETELQINRMSAYFDLLKSMSTSTQLWVTHEKTLHIAQSIIIADCYHAEVHRVMDVRQIVGGQIITLDNPLAFTYQSPVYVGEWLQERFFVPSQGGLSYHRHHTEQLTPLVKRISIHVNKALVQVKLGLSDARTLALDTKVRAK